LETPTFLTYWVTKERVVMPTVRKTREEMVRVKDINVEVFDPCCDYLRDLTGHFDLTHFNYCPNCGTKINHENNTVLPEGYIKVGG